MRVQAGVVQNLSGASTQIQALITSSQSASGALQAAQSGNQLVALQTRQLADLTAEIGGDLSVRQFLCLSSPTNGVSIAVRRVTN
jgi:conjugal transfer/entry exclusion protein